MTLHKTEISTPSDREIRITRGFAAPRGYVFDAHTRPEVVKLWLGARNGWTFPVCEIDLRVGGRYRYVWKKGDHEMGMGGEFLEIVPDAKLVATELFDEPWYPGGAVTTTEFIEVSRAVTELVLTIRYDSKKTRDEVLKGPATEGVGESYDNLAQLLAR